MAFNSSTAAAFFKQGVIGFGERTYQYQKLVEEGIQLPEDLIDFTEDGLDAIFENFRRPGKVSVPKDDSEKKKMEKGKRLLGLPSRTKPPSHVLPNRI